MKQNPPNSVAAQFSLPWALANAITYRKMEIGQFNDKAIKNEKIRHLARKVEMQVEQQLARLELEPAVVEIRTKEGEGDSKRVEHALGSPQNPLSMEAVAEKLRSCASYAAKPVAEQRLYQVVQMVEGLEDVTDVGQIIRLLG